MNLAPHVEGVRRELVESAEPGEATALAERLGVTMASATRLALLEALTVAADEISREIAPASVHVRLRGRDPEFVVTPPSGESEGDPLEDPGEAARLPPTDAESGPAARINFRPPAHLKQQIEQAAAAADLSVNAWLVRTVGQVFQQGPPRRGSRGKPGSGSGFVGWVG